MHIAGRSDFSVPGEWLDRLDYEGDADNPAAAEAIAFYRNAGNWQMVAYIEFKCWRVQPMLYALALAYQRGDQWSQAGLHPPYGIKCWAELELAFAGYCGPIILHHGDEYWHGLKLPEQVGAIAASSVIRPPRRIHDVVRVRRPLPSGAGAASDVGRPRLVRSSRVDSELKKPHEAKPPEPIPSIGQRIANVVVMLWVVLMAVSMLLTPWWTH